MERETHNIDDDLLDLSGGVYQMECDVILSPSVEYITITIPLESEDD